MNFFVKAIKVPFYRNSFGKTHIVVGISGNLMRHKKLTTLFLSDIKSNFSRNILRILG